MAKMKRCPNCGRYRAKEVGWFRKRLKCDYCKAETKVTVQNVIIKTGFFSRTRTQKTVFNVKGGSQWRKQWNKNRKKALKRAKYRCEKCKSQMSLEVHHKKPVSKGGKDNLRNLQVLCQSCHKKVHARRR
ncbi:MAG: HNH endonuclease signature motif containing protein [Chloroflexota bacterium]